MLGLEVRGRTSIHTPSTGMAYVVRDQFEAHLVLGAAGRDALSQTLLVIESDFANQGFFALVGRDLLDLCVFHYDGPSGRFRLRW